jgi:hypothetical protein
MSKYSKQLRSLQGAANDPTMAPIAPLPVETSAPIQEMPMPPTVDQVQDQAPEASPEAAGPTAKQLAAIEEENASRLIRQANANAQRAEHEQPAEKLIGLAAQGRQVLMDKLRAHAQKPPAPPYVPPPMTERQKQQLKEEMEAGAKRVAVAAASQIRASHPTLPQTPDDQRITPVHRPGEFVPGLNSKDPLIR